MLRNLWLLNFFSRNWSYLRWPELTYMRVAYIFELRFSAGTIYPFAMILASLITNRGTLRKRYLFSVGINTFVISGIYLKLHFNKNVHTFKILRQSFPLLQQISLIALSSFISDEFEVNRDLTTRCTKCWSTLTSKCYGLSPI